MSQTIDFMDVSYNSITSIQQTAPLLRFFLYPSLLERYQTFTIMQAPNLEAREGHPLPSRLGQCRVWTQNPNLLFSHKHKGLIDVRLVSTALSRPEFIHKHLNHRTTHTLSFVALCGTHNCIHPMHVTCNQDPLRGAAALPCKRRVTRPLDDWLGLLEYNWLINSMNTSVAKDLETTLKMISDRLHLSRNNLLQVWNNYVDTERKRFYETFKLRATI